MTIEYNGKQYTLKELAAILGIKYDTLAQRRSRGWTDEELVNGRRIRNGQMVTIYGQTFESINQAAKELHLTPYKIKQILKNKSPLCPIINHKQYNSKAEAMRELNCSIGQVNRAMHLENEYTIKIFDNRENAYYYFKDEQDLTNYYDVDKITDIYNIGKPIFYNTTK